MARVLPVPAPARMQPGPAGAVTAARCSSSSPARIRSTVFAATGGIMSARYDVPTGAEDPMSLGSAFYVDRVLDQLVRPLPPTQDPTRPRRHRVRLGGYRTGSGRGRLRDGCQRRKSDSTHCAVRRRIDADESVNWAGQGAFGYR